MSSSTSIPHEFAKETASLRDGRGMFQCLSILSQRAWGNEVLRACISSLLYGVSRTRFVPLR